MRIVLAPDSYKDCLSSPEVCRILAETARWEIAGVDVLCFPMGDGGEGTLEAVVEATHGTKVETLVRDPLGRPIHASWGYLPDNSAFIEMAQASGLERLSHDERNPMLTSTYGTGQLVKAALDRGCRRLTIGIGGSATTDGGAGLASALGARLLDADGREFVGKGEDLARIARVDLSHLDARLQDCEFMVASDVSNPLCGATGAAAVFGPQKGATPVMVAELDRGLAHWAALLAGGEENARCAGDGAAGGLGFGLRVLCKAKMSSGARLVAELTGLPEAIREADIVVTGEGRTDRQTLFGKLPSVVADYAKASGVPCILISGALEGAREDFQDAFTASFGCVSRVWGLEEALAHARESLESVSRSVFAVLAMGNKQAAR